MALWKNISTARTTAGVFWFPALTLDAMGRDWAGFTLPLNFVVASVSQTINTSTWTTLTTLTCVLPKNWADDATFDEGLRVQMSVTLDFTAVIDLEAQARVRIEDGDQETQFDTSATLTLTKTVDFSTTRQSIVIQALKPANGMALSCEVSKSHSDGPVGAIRAVKA